MKNVLYDFKKIEYKWQRYWNENKVFKTSNNFYKKKFYCLDMFPYPSAEGLHVGHIEGYTASDIFSRFKKMQGYNVLHPFGWDSFGLPAEQYALKTGNNPRNFTYKNIKNFKEQIIKMGKGVDWDKELATSDNNFYRWTQWIFKKLYQKKLAVLKDLEVNFCEELGTVLANEEIVSKNGRLFSERGNFPVVKKTLKQWVLKITDYAERLLDDLELVDFPSNLKQIQRNWIGKTSGVIITFKVDGFSETFDIFTTRPDTIFGVTCCILAPEHILVKKITRNLFKTSIFDYIEQTKQKQELERSIDKNKTGVFTGSYAINPVNQKKVPIWISDYILPHYGTGALAAVPAHDRRDFEFAKKYKLEIISVIKDKDNKIQEFFCGDGIHFKSQFLDGLNNELAKIKIIEFLEKNKLGYIHNIYKFHDYFFSRQRYWGEPFPVFYDEKDNIHLLSDDELPLELPYLKDFKPSNNVKDAPPLSRVKNWIYFEKNGKKYRRDSNTMSQLAGSSWYYIAYILKNNSVMMPLNTSDSKKKIDYFLPVDLYIGGAEHSTGHLLCVRFWHKVLYDLGLVSTKEPFKKIVHQGIILGDDNTKMSKSKGNGVSAKLMLDKYGADVLRLYEMFLGPLTDTKIWSYKNIKGSVKFLERVYNIFNFEITKINQKELDFLYHKTVKKVTDLYEKLKFNVAISQLMIFVNEVYKHKKISKYQVRGFLKLLNPIAPHLTEELNQLFLNEKPICFSSFPSYDKSFLSLKNVEIIIQINGKLRSKITSLLDQSKENILKIALKDPKIINYVSQEKKIQKIIYVTNKLLNIVLKK
ncbi:leucine--tRNA ligase [Candidatus Phytoplasma prunorum]|uniref:leucine--tRNA ligase n=1 Tax=Candidatus Phytoplasma prunorum TaxID=47565 RepID=UPI002FF3F704